MTMSDKISAWLELSVGVAGMSAGAYTIVKYVVDIATKKKAFRVFVTENAPEGAVDAVDASEASTHDRKD